MDLAELKFLVNTDDLETAAVKIKALGTAVEGLKTPMKAVEQASAALGTSTKATGAATEATTESTKKQVTILERQQKVLEYMTQGFSKGQSSVMAYGDAAGLTTRSLDELGKVLQTQRTLMGTDPFDKSLGAMQSLKNEYIVLKEVQRLYNAELGLSRSQMEDLAREKLRLIEKLKLEGSTLTDIKNGIKELNSAYLSNAAAETTLATNMKAREKAANDATRSTSFLEKEMRRVDNALSEVNSTLLISNSNRLLKFQDELKKSGVSGAAAASQLEIYRKKLVQIQTNSAFKKQSDEADAYKNKVDYITRAVGPQLTDIFSGLATGQQSLYTILVQQGGQLADQFSLAGIEADKMGAILQSALPKMITNFTNIGKAIGTMMIGGLKAAGDSIISFGTSITGTKKRFAELQAAMEISSAAGSRFAGVLLTAIGGAATVVGAGVVALIGSFVALGVAQYQAIRDTAILSKAFAINGTALGMTTASAYQYASAANIAGASTSDVVGVMAEMSKVGRFSKDSLDLITRAALDMERYGGVAIAETVKQAAKMKDEPVKALAEYAANTGYISVAVLQSVIDLEKQGKTVEAGKIAMNAWGEATKNAASKIKEEMHPVSKLFDELLIKVNDLWKGFGKLIAGGSDAAKIAANEVTIKELSTGPLSSMTKMFIPRLEQENVLLREKIRLETKDIELNAEQASATKAINANLKIVEDTEKELLSLSKKKLTQQQFINASVDDYVRKVGGESKTTAEGLRLTKELAAAKWESAQPKGKTDAQKAAEKALLDLKAAMEAYIDIENKAIGIDSSFNNNLAKLQLAYSSGKVSVEKYTQAVVHLVSQQPFAIKLAKDEADNQKRLNDAKEAGIDIIRRMNEASDVVSTNRQETLAATGLGTQAATELKTRQDTIKEYAKLQEQLYKANKEKGTQESADYKAKTEEIKAGLASRLAENTAYYEALKQAQGDWTNGASTATSNYLTSLGDIAGKTEQVFTNAFKGMEDALVDFVKTGKLDFSSLANSIISDLIRITIQQSIMKPFTSGGGGDMLGSLMQIGLAAFTGTPAASSGNSMYSLGSGTSSGLGLKLANGGAFTDGIQKFAKGGSFSNSVVDSPTMFKFAKGTGLMGEAGPEAIMPLRRDASGSLGVVASGGSGSNVSVSIINNTSEKASTKETTDSRGNRRVEVVIGDMTASEVQRSGSTSQKAMKSTFGVQPLLIRR